jgi:site-specific DNA-cytosine methylase
MPRSSKNGNGGNGPLQKFDGKSYCLDTGNSNAIEIFGGDYRSDDGYRWRNNYKSPTLCTSTEALAKINKTIRRLTPIECERLQTVNDNYTDCVSDSQRYKMLGNGWTIDVIAFIFKYIQ